MECPSVITSDVFKGMTPLCLLMHTNLSRGLIVGRAKSVERILRGSGKPASGEPSLPHHISSTLPLHSLHRLPQHLEKLPSPPPLHPRRMPTLVHLHNLEFHPDPLQRLDNAR